MRKGHLFVISGSSGVGKSSVLKEVMARRSDLQFSVSATSRPPRPGEENGVQYYFVSPDAFRQMIEQGAFVEYDYHMENYYGTLKSEILNKTKQCNLVLDVEPMGALRVREIYPEATLIYVAPPSLEALYAGFFSALCSVNFAFAALPAWSGLSPLLSCFLEAGFALCFLLSPDACFFLRFGSL